MNARSISCDLPVAEWAPCAANSSACAASAPGAGVQIPSGRPFIQFRQLSKRFGRVEALAGVTFAVEQGSVLALLGPNGAGKSTLFGCLLGLIHPGEGEITVGAAALGAVDRSHWGYVAERIALYPQRSVIENGLFFAGLRNQTREELVRQLKRVGLAAVQDRPVRHLSKGMLQRLALAIALCGQPDLLVLDEPFNGLDPALLEGLRRILREENARGATLLISTHTMSAVEPLATHAAILLHGRLAAAGNLADLRASQPGESSLEAIYHRIARQDHGINPEEIPA